jgi:hypothetical protein
MFEYGRPSHIFDLDKIHGGLVVRWGRPGETLKLLNGNTIEVDEQVGVIADAQAVESLAGIMGGDATAVSDDTTQRLRRGRVLVARGRGRAARAATTSHRRRPPLRARRRPGADGRAHRAHHAADPRHLRRRAGADGRPDAALPERTPGDAARGARRQGHRHAADAGAVRRRVPRLGLPFTKARARSPSRRRAGASTCDRGRPDRGGDPRHRLRQAARPRRRWRR